MASNEDDQCKAITDDGTRCSRPAQEDGFCHQHGPDDETVEDDDVSSEDEQASGEGSVSDDGDEGTEMPDDVEMDDFEEIVEQVDMVASTILGHPLDSVTAINRADDGWEVTVQVIERESVPDTQDILGEYELTFDDSISPVGYERTARYRRDQMQQRV